MNKSRLLWILLLLLLILKVSFELVTKSYYSGSVSDDAYYFAVGNSFFQTGFSQDITVNPARPAFNPHWGITIVYGFLGYLGFDFLQISIITMVFGAILHLLSVLPLKKITHEFELDDNWALIIACILIFIPGYIGPLLAGRTETIFYPLFILWLSMVLNFEKDQTKLLAVVIVSVILLSFRIQAIVCFIAWLSPFIFKKDLKVLAKKMAIISLVIAFVFLVNYLMTETVFSRADKILERSVQVSLVEKFIGNFVVVSYLLSSKSNTILDFVGQFAFVVSMSGLFVITLKEFKSDKIIIIFVILGSIASYLLVANPKSFHWGHLRYISYIIPILLIYCVSFLKSTISYKWATALFIIVLILPELRFNLSDWKHLNFKKEINIRQIERFHYFKNNPNRGEPIYTYDLPMYETHRLVYSSTEKSLNLFDKRDEMPQNAKRILIKKSNLNEFDLNEYRVDYEFKINDEYVVLNKKISS